MEGAINKFMNNSDRHPTPDEFYDKNYHSKRHKKLIDDAEYYQARAEALVALYFSNDEMQKRIFEYGCGIGQGIAMLANAKGWDISAEAREYCKKRNIPVYDDFKDVPRRAWDIVFCRHVLEHVEEPLAALKSMRELIADKGELYLVLPKEKHSLCSFEHDLDQHLYCWNFRSIKNLLYRAGFAPYLISYKYSLGYRVLLPLRRLFGKRVYFHTARLVGLLKRNGELIIRARLA
jgi:SAM-dependent methyltransferase